MAFSSIPPYFSWVVDRLLAVSAYPYHHTHLRYLIENGINTIVSINDEFQPPFHTRPNLRVINLSIPGNVPTVSQCQQFVALIENAKQRKDVCFKIFFIMFVKQIKTCFLSLTRKYR
jgi:hypothetical protein